MYTSSADFIIISYFDFRFTSAYTIRFCSVIFGVTSSLAVIYTRFMDNHKCVQRATALGRSRAVHSHGLHCTLD